MEPFKINTSRTLIKKHAKLLKYVLKHYNYTCPQLKREIYPFLAKCWPSPAPNQHRAFSSHLLGLAVRKSQCCLATIAAATVSITVLATTAAATVTNTATVYIAVLAITAASATVNIAF